MRALRIAILNTWGGARGGAARAVYRLHTELRQQGVDSTLLAVDEIPEGDPSVVRLKDVGYRFARWATKWALRHYPKPWPGFSLNLLSRTRANAHPVVRQADAVLLGWVGQDFLSPAGLGRLRPPILWRLSDIWPFSGGCHYPRACTRYEERCGACPLLDPTRERDVTRRQWTAKSTAYRSLNLSFAAPSRWIADVARQSSLGKEYPIYHLPSGVDTEVFHPGDRIRARRSLGLPEDGPMLMFGAVNSLGSPRKGYAELSEALHILAARPAHNRLRLAIFGNERPVAEGTFSFPVHDLGSVATDADLARLYPAADVLVAPSIEENLPNVVMEAMACGVPCAAFDVGGMSDLIRDGLTGALARTTDAPTLANAISRLLETASPSLAESSRQHIVKQYDLRRQAAAYRKVLEDLARLAARRVIALSQPLRR